MSRRYCRCGNGPGALSPDDQAAVDAFLAMLAARRSPGQDTADESAPTTEAYETDEGDHAP